MIENMTPDELRAEVTRLRDEHHKLQVALLQAGKRLNIFFQEALDVILIVDTESGEILDANKMTTHVLGYDEETIVGQPFSMLFPSAIDEDEYHMHGMTIGGQEFLRADGSICPMDLTFKIIPWHDDDIAILVTLRDVTERREAELQQQKLIEELDAFSHMVAHDLKVPLTGMIGTASFLTSFDDSLPPDKRQEMIELIMQSGQKMRNIIEELLLLAQMRNKEVELTPVDMASIVAESRKRLSHMIQEYQAELIVPAEWPEALGYGPWIEEVWTNYISNALKYGGQPPRIEVGGSATGNGSVRFWVRDNGPGLTPEEQAKLFTQFTQLAKVRAEGHGLGLSIVRRIVEKLGGKVSVESEVGLGSEFSFTLPRINGE